MPLLATGALTLVLVFYLGYALRGQASTTLSSTLVTSLLYSLLLTWGIFLLAYGLGLSALLTGALVLALAAFFWWSGHYRPLRETTIHHDGQKLIPVLIVVLAAAVLLMAGLYLQRFHTSTFTFWDAVVSYNSWAIELSQNRYDVGGAAYPVLYPGIWSLIYRLQGNPEFWILSKATLFAAPIILFAYATSLSLERRSLFPILFLLAGTGLIVFRTPFFVSGMMDIALVIMTMLSCLILWQESTQEKPASLSLLSAALTSLVKQAGLAVLLLAVLMKIHDIFTHRAHFRDHFPMFMLGIGIPLSFLLFFLYHQDFTQITASITGLQTVALNAASGESLFLHAFGLLRTIMPPYISLPLLALLVLGIYWSAPRLRWLAIFSLLIALTGLLVWFTIASYDIRNVYWAFILLIFVAMIGLQAILLRLLPKTLTCQPESPVRGNTRAAPRWLKPLVVTAPLLLLLPLLFQSEETLWQKNTDSRNLIIPKALEPMFSSTPLGMQMDFKVLTNEQPLLWAPKLQGRIQFHPFTGAYQPLKDTMLSSDAAVLLVKKLAIGRDYPNIQRLQKERLLIKIAGSDLYDIYRIRRPD